MPYPTLQANIASHKARSIQIHERAMAQVYLAHPSLVNFVSFPILFIR